MRRLSLDEVLVLHDRLIDSSGGATGIRDWGALDSALAQPFATFDGNDLYPDLVAKAAALCFSLVMNHPFLDGNKRVGHAAMETLLVLNGSELVAPVGEQEQVMLDLAARHISREAFARWVREHTGTI